MYACYGVRLAPCSLMIRDPRAAFLKSAESAESQYGWRWEDGDVRALNNGRISFEAMQRSRSADNSFVLPIRGRRQQNKQNAGAG